MSKERSVSEKGSFNNTKNQEEVLKDFKSSYNPGKEWRVDGEDSVVLESTDIKNA